MHRILYLLIFTIIVSACSDNQRDTSSNSGSDSSKILKKGTELIILGTLQDGGLPHIGCKKSCCVKYFDNPDPRHKVVSLGVIDYDLQETYIFEATPDFAEQIELLNSKITSPNTSSIPTGIFITHAHIGHYTGLMYLGKEAKNAEKALVYCMPKMRDFLSTNGPWSQLVNNQNIVIETLGNKSAVQLSKTLSVHPFTVPHRDEYSETVGFKIIGPHKKILFIPDIDKWNKWEQSIIAEIKTVDLAFIDGTFYDEAEINYRNIKEIPHPFVIESMELMKNLEAAEKEKIHFIHFNHTNPLNINGSAQFNKVLEAGFNISKYGSIYAI